MDDKMPSVEAVDSARTGESSKSAEQGNVIALGDAQEHGEAHGSRGQHHHFKVYKRRWFGLFQLTLLNIIVSWDWLTFSAISTTAAQYFNVSEGAINWLSTGFLFAFVVISPLTLWILHYGPKPSIIISAILILVGNWIKYGGTRTNNFGVVVFAQVLVGLAQPFVLAAPTRYSDLWFTERGRVSATAVASLANAFGGALGQLVSPAWATDPSQIPNTVLYVAIISSVAAVPSFFIPAKPPTPPSASSSLPKTELLESLKDLGGNLSFWLIFIPFSIYVGFFNAVSSLINQILSPYNFSETQAGIAGGLLILVGLVTAAITSPILDRTHAYLFAARWLSPIIGICYLAFVWAPQTRSLAAPFVILSILGASSFALVPAALEYLVEITFPASPEVTSVICWAAGQLTGGIFIVIMNALKDGNNANPPQNMYRALVFEAVLCGVAAPLPQLLGRKFMGLGGDQRRRFLVDEAGERELEQRDGTHPAHGV